MNGSQGEQRMSKTPCREQANNKLSDYLIYSATKTTVCNVYCKRTYGQVIAQETYLENNNKTVKYFFVLFFYAFIYDVRHYRTSLLITPLRNRFDSLASSPF